jgi:hypothetical protein
MSKATDPDVFRRKLEEARESTTQEAIPMVFEGFPCQVLPLPRIHFINAGRMPEHLTNRLIRMVDKPRDDDEQGEQDEQTAAQTVENENFMRVAVCAVMVEPRVVESGPVPEGGYLYADLLRNAKKFVSAVFAWVMRDCPAPKEQKGEEVLGVEDLENFPDGAGRGAGAKSGDKGEGGGEGAVPASTTHRKRNREK